MPDYDLNPVKEMDQQNARHEQQLSDMVAADPSLKPRLDDVVAARQVYWDLGQDLPALLWRGGISLESFFYKGKEWPITS